MHIVEGVQCGLPLVYHDDGGGIVEIGRRFGIALPGRRCWISRRGAAAVREAAKVLADAASGDAMCASYRRIIERLLVEA